MRAIRFNSEYGPALVNADAVTAVSNDGTRRVTLSFGDGGELAVDGDFDAVVSALSAVLRLPDYRTRGLVMFEGAHDRGPCAVSTHTVHFVTPSGIDRVCDIDTACSEVRVAGTFDEVVAKLTGGAP